MTREELADKFNGQADWRWQKFEKHPNDTRNRDAAGIFQRLAATAAEVPDYLLNAYDAAFLRLADTSGDMSSLIETESQALRDVDRHRVA
jgi:hypothetical protein